MVEVGIPIDRLAIANYRLGKVRLSPARLVHGIPCSVPKHTHGLPAETDGRLQPLTNTIVDCLYDGARIAIIDSATRRTAAIELACPCKYSGSDSTYCR